MTAGTLRVNSNNGRVYLSQTASATSYTTEWTPPADANGPLDI